MQNLVTSTLREMKEEVQRRVTEAASATDSDWLNCEMLRSNQRWYVVISVDIFKDENEFVPISLEKSTARANVAVNSIESVVFFVAFPRSKSWQIVLTRWWLAPQCTRSDEGCSETLGTGYQFVNNFCWFVSYTGRSPFDASPSWNYMYYVIHVRHVSQFGALFLTTV